MKTLCGILFSIYFLLTTMQEATFFLLYKLNEKSITEKYCVNRNVKGSCCKGKCHLEKTIAKAENDDLKNPFSTLNFKTKEIEIFFSTLNRIQQVCIHSFTYLTQNKFKYASSLLDGVSFSLIKPPMF